MFGRGIGRCVAIHATESARLQQAQQSAAAEPGATNYCEDAACLSAIHSRRQKPERTPPQVDNEDRFCARNRRADLRGVFDIRETNTGNIGQAITSTRS